MIALNRVPTIVTNIDFVARIRLASRGVPAAAPMPWVAAMPSVAGVADRGGRLVVPDPRSFEANTIALDPLTLSDEAQAAKTSFTLRPRDRTGVLTDFGVRQVRAARVTLGIADGTPLPLGSRAALNGGKAVPVGDEREGVSEPATPTERGRGNGDGRLGLPGGSDGCRGRGASANRTRDVPVRASRSLPRDGPIGTDGVSRCSPGSGPSMRRFRGAAPVCDLLIAGWNRQPPRQPSFLGARVDRPRTPQPKPKPPHPVRTCATI